MIVKVATNIFKFLKHPNECGERARAGNGGDKCENILCQF